jgi:hypothetical protein
VHPAKYTGLLRRRTREALMMVRIALNRDPPFSGLPAIAADLPR